MKINIYATLASKRRTTATTGDGVSFEKPYRTTWTKDRNYPVG